MKPQIKPIIWLKKLYTMAAIGLMCSKYVLGYITKSLPCLQADKVQNSNKNFFSFTILPDEFFLDLSFWLLILLRAAYEFFKKACTWSSDPVP